MFGCLRKIGCLVLIVAGVAGYFWYKHRSDRSMPPAPPAGTWALVTPADAERGREAVERLRGSSEQMYATLTPAQAVGYLLQRTKSQFLSSSEGVQAMITGDTLHVKAVLSLSDFGGAKVLGPLASVLSARDTIQLSGTVSHIDTGYAQLRITDARIHNLRIPRGAIPKLIGELRRSAPAGIAPDGLPFPVPSYISEIRISNGKVTLYKNI
jgi:hypothetical protein